MQELFGDAQVTKKSSGLVDTIFWLAVVTTACLSWGTVVSLSDDALTMTFVVGAVGLATGMISKMQEEES